MSLSEAMAAEWAHETSTTRRALERVPPASLDWRPHEKSRTMGELASHVANLPMLVGVTLRGDGFDLAARGSPLAAFDSVEAMLAAFDGHVAEALATIRDTPQEAWMDTWTLRYGEKEVFSAHRVAAMRGFIMNHAIHHRGQLTVYLRLAGAAVPQIYGPSADEPDF
ncbi:MAG: DinB family protein [Gemmatimonadota bacterium]